MWLAPLRDLSGNSRGDIVTSAQQHQLQKSQSLLTSNNQKVTGSTAVRFSNIDSPSMVYLGVNCTAGSVRLPNNIWLYRSPSPTWWTVIVQRWNPIFASNYSFQVLMVKKAAMHANTLADISLRSVV